MSGRKSGKFDQNGIEALAKNKPVVYRIQDQAGNDQYLGVAKREK